MGLKVPSDTMVFWWPAYAKGELPKADTPREAVVLPLEYLQEVTKAKTEAQAAVGARGAHQKHAEAHAARADKLAHLAPPS